MNEEKYQITSLIEKGGTGGVYKATDTALNREVAIRRFFSLSGNTDPSVYEEEFTEISLALSHLQHPSLLTVLEAGVDEDGAYLVTQLTEGKSLSKVVTASPIDEPTAYSMALQLLDALSAAHVSGFIHGALTPRSIKMKERPRGGYRFTIIDLGLSHLAPLIQREYTEFGMMADPLLMSPELFEGEPTSEHSDCYMLGQIIYLSLVGGHPFAGKGLLQLQKLHKSGALPPLSKFRRDVSPAFRKWLKKLIHPSPQKRYPTAAVALLALAECSPLTPLSKAPHESTPKKSYGPLFTVIALFTLCVLSTCFIFSRSNQPADSQIKPKNEVAEKRETTYIEAPIWDLLQVSEQLLHTTNAENNHPRTAADVSDQRNIDWTVFTGPTPNTNNHTCANTDHISAVSTIGEPSVSSGSVSNLLFYNESGELFQPSLYAQCKQAGDGWNIPFQSLDFAEDDRAIIIHFTVWNCDAELQFSQAGNSNQSQNFNHSSESTSTSYAIRYSFPADSFKGLEAIDLSLRSINPKSDKSFGVSLSAIILE